MENNERFKERDVLFTKRKTKKAKEYHDEISQVFVGVDSRKKESSVRATKISKRLQVRCHGTTNLAAFTFGLGAILSADQRISSEGMVLNELYVKIARFDQNSLDPQDTVFYTHSGGLGPNVFVRNEMDEYDNAVLTLEESYQQIHQAFWRSANIHFEVGVGSLVLGFDVERQIQLYYVDYESVRHRGGAREVIVMSGLIPRQGDFPLIKACGSGGELASNFVTHNIDRVATEDEARLLALEALFEAMCVDDATGGPITVGFLRLDGEYFEETVPVLRVYGLFGNQFENNSVLVVLPFDRSRYEFHCRHRLKECFSRPLNRRTIDRRPGFTVFLITYDGPEMLEEWVMRRVTPLQPWGEMDREINWKGTKFYVREYTYAALDTILSY